MCRCDLCNTYLLDGNKTKHNQAKKHKYCSNFILNQYVIKNVELSKFKDVFNPYLTAQARKFNFFSVSFLLRSYDEGHLLSHKKLCQITSHTVSTANITHTTELANDFLHRVISIYFSDECSTKINPEL